MDLAPTGVCEAPPRLAASCVPPAIRGTALLAHRAYAGASLEATLAELGPAPDQDDRLAGWLLDLSVAYRLHFQAEAASALQAQALQHAALFRVAGALVPRSASPLRVLALVAPGDLMVNVPLDFITAHLDVQLDLLFLRPGQALPARVPEHDLAFCAVSECDAASLRRLQGLRAVWPRPVLNDPAAILRLTRETLFADLDGLPGLHVAEVLRLSAAELTAAAQRGEVPLLPPSGRVLVRPQGSHAGTDLAQIATAAELSAYLADASADAFHVTRYVDYRGADGLFRKYRVAFVDGAPFLCHMATSEHWMVHYLNAGMAEHAERRAEEDRAMRDFDAGFARRHAAALSALVRRIGLDYFQIDCTELPDGRLMVFEAAVAGIVHLLDPPDLFPYKPAQMRRVFAAFEAMLRQHAQA